VYEETGAKLFIESREHQAIEICERTNRPVYCYETNGMIQPNRLKEFYWTSADYFALFRDQPLQFSRDASEYFVNRITNRIHR